MNYIQPRKMGFITLIRTQERTKINLTNLLTDQKQKEDDHDDKKKLVTIYSERGCMVPSRTELF